jgi:hypothetical protein
VITDEADGQSSTLCPTCGATVDQSGEGVHFAVELQRIGSVESTEYDEGTGGFFHPDCSIPSDWRWRPKP